jgi:AcrR family transcriptional regulator
MAEAPAQRKRSNTRARLLESAAELFAERGTTAVGIDDICRKAGFTRGAFYSNFDTVEDVFFAVYEMRTDDLLVRLAQAPRPGIAAASLDDAVSALLDVIPADPDWYAIRASFAARARARPEIAEGLRAHGEALRSGLEPFIQHTVTSAGRRLIMSPADAARVVIAAHVGAVLQLPLADDTEHVLRRNALRAALAGVSEPDPSISID